MTLLALLDMIGTFAFATTGALVAVRKDMDLFGIIVLSFVTAIGGGTTRDVLLGNTPVFFLYQPSYFYISLAAALCVFLFHRELFKINSIVLIFDALGLGLFVCVGISKALTTNTSFTGAVILGVVTGTVGGIIRDLLAGQIPTVLVRDFYALICVVGGILYVYLYQLKIPEDINLLVSASVIFVLRLAAIKLKWNFVKAPRSSLLQSKF
ncbi:trimeric intracellular cation channel family protein [Desulfotomaculum defluvii]